jgi:hypothetical protein
VAEGQVRWGNPREVASYLGGLVLEVEENYEVSPRGSFWVDRNLRCTTFFFGIGIGILWKF